MVRLLEVTALDFWSFGGLQNFQAGIDTYRDVLFPPNIMRFFHLVNLKKTKVLGVLVKKDGKLYFPVPADVVRPRKGKSGPLKVAILKNHAEGVTDINTKYLPVLEEDEKYEGASGFIEFFYLKSYFEGCLRASTENLLTQSAFVEKELKVGLTLDKDDFTAQESRLYTSFVLRPKAGVKLVALIKSDNGDPLRGYYYFGGETRVSRVNVSEDKELECFLRETVKVEKGKLYRFYLLSHAYVEGDLDVGKKLVIGGAEFKLVWAFTGGSEWISGYNKPAIHMLKPATVLVLEPEEEKQLQRLTYLNAKARLPVYKSRSSNEILDEEVNLHDYGWNWGILSEYREGGEEQ